MEIQGGTLTGSGTIDGDLINGGGVSPGGDGVPGVLTVAGNYTQTTLGVLNIDLGGVEAGSEYD